MKGPKTAGLLAAAALALAGTLLPATSSAATEHGSLGFGQVIRDGEGNMVDLADHTMLVSDDTMAAVGAVDQGRVEFTSQTDQVKALAAGDVIVNRGLGMAPLYVTSVDRVGDTTTLTTRAATMTEAYEDVVVHKRVAGDGISGVTGDAFSSAGLSDEIKIKTWRTGVEFSAKISSDQSEEDDSTSTATPSKFVGKIESATTVSGKVEFNPDFDIDYSLKDRSFLAKASVEPQIDFSLKSENEASFGTNEDSDTWNLGTLEFRPVIFYVGPVPFTVSPELSLDFSASGKLNVSTEVKYTCNMSGAMGFSVHGTEVTPIKEFAGCSGSPTWKGEISGSATIEAKLELSLLIKIDEVAGPKVTLGAVFEAKVSTSDDPWNTISLWVEYNIGGEFEVEHTPWKFEVNLFNEPQKILGPRVWNPLGTGPLVGVKEITVSHNHGKISYPGELNTLTATTNKTDANKITWGRTDQAKYDIWFVDPSCTSSQLTLPAPTSGACARRDSWIGATAKVYSYRNPTVDGATPVTDTQGAFSQGEFGVTATPSLGKRAAATVKVLRVLPEKPTAARSLTTTARWAAADLNWAQPVDDGGGYIDSYLVTATTSNTSVSPSRRVVTSRVYGTTTRLSGLAEKVSYTITVKPHNSAGYGPAIAKSVTPLAPIRVSGAAIKVGYIGSEWDEDALDKDPDMEVSEDGRYILYNRATAISDVSGSSNWTPYLLDRKTKKQTKLPFEQRNVYSHNLELTSDGRQALVDGQYLYDFESKHKTDVRKVIANAYHLNPASDGTGYVNLGRWMSPDGAIVAMYSPSEDSTDVYLAVVIHGKAVKQTKITTPGYRFGGAKFAVTSNGGKRVLVQMTDRSETATPGQCVNWSNVLVVEPFAGTKRILGPPSCSSGALEYRGIGISPNGKYASVWRTESYLGDMYRVSLTGDPKWEVMAAPEDLVNHNLWVYDVQNATVSDDGRTIAWTQGTPQDYDFIVCDLPTETCAVPVDNDPSVQLENALSGAGAIAFSGKMKRVHWIAANGNIMERRLTW